MAKLRVQIPFTKFGVIEISEIEVKDLDKGINWAKEQIKKHSSELGMTAKAASNDGVKLNPKQWGFIKNNGGDVNKKFNNWDEVNTYIDGLKKTTPKVEAAKTDDTPWEMEL